MTLASNPLTMVYDGLWTMLTRHLPLAALVASGNRIKFSGEAANPDKPEVLSSDLPYLRLVCPGLSAHIQQTSSSGMLTARFEIQVATGEQGLDASKGLLAVVWEVFRAMHGWQAVLVALTWNSKAFVHLARPVDATSLMTTTNAESPSKGIKGWSCIWAAEVQMHFSTPDLEPVIT